MQIRGTLLVLFITLLLQPSAPAQSVDRTTLMGKVLLGYQGWFRCPGDAADRGWVHWSRDAKRIAPETLSFEMWPDLSEFSSEEKYLAPIERSLERGRNPGQEVLEKFQGAWKGDTGALLDHCTI